MPFVDDRPSKGEIFSYWKNRLQKQGFFVDWAEPGCWACGFHYDGKYDLRTPNASLEKILARWQRIPLQRCHIVPRGRGGSNKPSNFFLMCRECHDLAPDTTSRKVFFDWARTQRSLHRELAKIKAALESFGVEEADLDKMSNLMASKQFLSWAGKRIERHRPQSGYASRSSRLKYSSVIGLALEYQRTRKPGY